jgi:hypothetical protein
LKVSNLLSQIENEWNHKREEMHRETSDYQTEMLENQELIAQRTMRDSTVMKVIAILTALFLPGTFIAVRPRHPSLAPTGSADRYFAIQILFTVPVFHWDDEDPIQPHLITYWIFTVPITTTFVVGFSIWFAGIWRQERREEKERARKRLQRKRDRERDVADAAAESARVEANTAGLRAAVEPVVENSYGSGV